MTPRIIELTLAGGALWLAAAVAVWALFFGLRALARWWRERRVHIRLFPTLDDLEADAIRRSDTRTIGRIRREKQAMNRAALERAAGG